ncbi:MAG: hypothetical protein N6V49_03095 [Serratia symbiotica]|nr:hypothetical protein [Serratia symbiotica]
MPGLDIGRHPTGFWVCDAATLNHRTQPSSTRRGLWQYLRLPFNIELPFSEN